MDHRPSTYMPALPELWYNNLPCTKETFRLCNTSASMQKTCAEAGLYKPSSGKCASFFDNHLKYTCVCKITIVINNDIRTFFLSQSSIEYLFQTTDWFLDPNRSYLVKIDTGDSPESDNYSDLSIPLEWDEDDSLYNIRFEWISMADAFINQNLGWRHVEYDNTKHKLGSTLLIVISGLDQ